MDLPRDRSVPISLSSEAQLRLGGATIDPVSREATFAAGAERLQPQNLKVLIALARQKGRVVTRSTLTEVCWGGRIVGEDVINRAISTLRHFAARAGGFSIETVPRAGYRLIETPSQANTLRAPALALLSLISLALLIWPFIRLAPGSVPSVEVRPATPDQRSKDAAFELTTRLATIEGRDPATFDLIKPGWRIAGPNLIFQVRSTEEQKTASRQVNLVFATDRTVIWAARFDEPSAHSNILDDQVGLASTVALDCALEAAGVYSKIEHQSLRFYLNGCSRLPAEFDESVSELIPVFEAVIKQAPGFAPGWDKLLYAEALAINFDTDPALAAQLRRHLQASSRLGIDVNSTAFAKAALLPRRAYASKIQTLQAGIANHPRSPLLEDAMAAALMDVGRHNDAIEHAARSVELDPLSPSTRAAQVWILAHSGKTDEARRKLDTIHRLWPTAHVVTSSQFSFEIRYGNPSVALELIRQGAARFNSSALWWFAKARAAPTAGNIDRAVTESTTFYGQNPEGLTALVQSQAQFGRSEDAIRTLLAFRYPAKFGAGSEPLFRPVMMKVWRDPRFMDAMDEWGLIDFWLRSGLWPDFCFDPSLPYDCKAESARIMRKGTYSVKPPA